MGRGKTNAFGFVILFFMLVLVSVGCKSEASEGTIKPLQNESNDITLTPVDLFTGENAKFKPFLGNMSGAFKLAYNGEKPNAALDIDLWKNGKRFLLVALLVICLVNHRMARKRKSK